MEAVFVDFLLRNISLLWRWISSYIIKLPHTAELLQESVSHPDDLGVDVAIHNLFHPGTFNIKKRNSHPPTLIILDHVA